MRQIGIWALAAVLILACGLLLPIDTRLSLHGEGSAWILWLAIATLLVLAVQSALNTLIESTAVRQRLALTGLLAIALTAVQFSQLPADFRVMSDEANVVATSKSLYERQFAARSAKGTYDEQGSYQSLFDKFDKRPLGFPAMLATVHATKGYSAYNGFLLNAVLGVVVLLLTAELIGLWAPAPIARFGMVLLAATPAYAFSVSSSGIEVLNLALLLATTFSAVVWARYREPQMWLVAMISAALLASVRNESVVFAGVVSAWLVAERLLRTKTLPVVSILPMLIWLPAAWQLAVPYDHEVGDGSLAAFLSFETLRAHTLQAFRFALFDGGEFGVSRLLGGLGIFGLILVAREAARQGTPRMDSSERWILVACVAASLITLLVVLSYWSGDFRDASTLRLSLPWVLLGAILATIAVQRLTAQIANQSAWLAAGSMLFLLNGAVDMARGTPLKSMEMSRGYQESLKALDTHCPNGECIVISQYGGWYGIHGYGVLAEQDVAANWTVLRAHFASGLSEDVLVVSYHDLDAPAFVLRDGTQVDADRIWSRRIRHDLMLTVGSLARSLRQNPAPSARP